MGDSKELLSFIHKNASMGVSNIPRALSLPQSKAMVEALDSQLREYRTITARCQAVARGDGTLLKGPNGATRAMSSAMLMTQTATDTSTSKLAELMIQGSTIGTVQMTRRLHQYSGAVDDEVLGLGQRLLRTEERNIQEMKQFL